MQSFERCIKCHDNFELACNVPVELIKGMRDNHIDRHDAGWSASTLTGCPRATALLATVEYYEPYQTAWNKFRGTVTHFLMEAERDPPDEVRKEERLFKEVQVLGETITISGKYDKAYTEQGVLIDFKSKEKLPKGPDLSHELQFNVYAWLLDGGKRRDGSISNVKITRGGMHYLSNSTKEPFKKIAYTRWTNEEIEAVVIKRLEPLVRWKQTGEMPKCDPYVKGFWDCDCARIEAQVELRKDLI